MDTHLDPSHRTARLLPEIRWKAWLSFLLFVLIFAACRPAEEAEEIKHTRDPDAPDVVAVAATPGLPQAEVTSSAVVGETDQPAPTMVPSATPTGTPVPATPSRVACANTYFFDPAPEPCPAGEALSGPAAEQPFEHGFMIWFGATDAIFVFDWDGRWQRFEDTFEEGQLEYDPALIPPAGLYQPVRGFGKVWRERPDVRDRLGWALGRELAFDSTLQQQETEAVGAEVVFLLAFNGQVLALTDRGSGSGDWVIAASS